MRAYLNLNKGSDLSFLTQFYADEGETEPYDLSDLSVSVYDAHPALAGHLSLEITNAAAGEVTGRLDWQEDMPEGQSMRFRIMLSDGTDQATTHEIYLVVQ